jgi:hypothetical protein
MAFRLLHTLERCGLIRKVGGEPVSILPAVVQTAALSPGIPPGAGTITNSPRTSPPACGAAADEGIELISVDNR